MSDILTIEGARDKMLSNFDELKKERDVFAKESFRHAKNSDYWRDKYKQAIGFEWNERTGYYEKSLGFKNWLKRLLNR